MWSAVQALEDVQQYHWSLFADAKLVTIKNVSRVLV